MSRLQKCLYQNEHLFQQIVFKSLLVCFIYACVFLLFVEDLSQQSLCPSEWT